MTLFQEEFTHGGFSVKIVGGIIFGVASDYRRFFVHLDNIWEEVRRFIGG